jgi:hypothetical protein
MVCQGCHATPWPRDYCGQVTAPDYRWNTPARSANSPHGRTGSLSTSVTYRHTPLRKLKILNHTSFHLMEQRVDSAHASCPHGQSTTTACAHAHVHKCYLTTCASDSHISGGLKQNVGRSEPIGLDTQSGGAWIIQQARAKRLNYDLYPLSVSSLTPDWMLRRRDSTSRPLIFRHK